MLGYVMPRKDTESRRAYEAEWRAKRRAKQPDFERIRAAKRRATESPARSRERKKYHRERMQAKRDADPEKYFEPALWRYFKITPAEYYALCAKQNNVCGCCGSASPGVRRKRWAVDHCHVTGNVRGLLCATCNTGIALLGDSPDGLRRALAYLEGTA